MPIIYCQDTFDNINDSHKIIIDKIIERTRNLEPWVRFANTRSKNNPWDKVYKNGDGNGDIIPIDLIKLID